MLFNLLKFYPKSNRPIDERGNNVTEEDRAIARKFDKEYFDGERLTGYGGYKYNPKFWKKTAEFIVDHYNLTNNSKILDIGCAKGFLMYELLLILPEAEILGIDISAYSKLNSLEVVKKNIFVGNANNLPFKSKYFDLVLSINTLHSLPLIDCKQAFREIIRVTKNNSFVMNDAWRNNDEKESMLKWNLTGLTYMSCKDWIKLFSELKYEGDYYWFFAK